MTEQELQKLARLFSLKERRLLRALGTGSTEAKEWAEGIKSKEGIITHIKNKITIKSPAAKEVEEAKKQTKATENIEEIASKIEPDGFKDISDRIRKNIKKHPITTIGLSLLAGGAAGKFLSNSSSSNNAISEQYNS